MQLQMHALCLEKLTICVLYECKSAIEDGNAKMMSNKARTINE